MSAHSKLHNIRTPKMKSALILLAGLLFLFSDNAMAQTGKECEAQSKQLQHSARHEFLKSCLAQASSAANVQAIAHQHRQAICAQNEKNMQRDGVHKPNYMNECLSKNEAAEAAAAHKTARSTHGAQPVQSEAPTPVKLKQNSKQSCTQQAQKSKLKGDKRKQFIKRCTAALEM